MRLLAQPLDWLGVNYYTRHFYAADPGQPWPATKEVAGSLPKTSMGWEIYPDGLHKFLARLARDHVGQLPIHVTENGMSWDDVLTGGAVNDPERAAYINAHAGAIRAAIADGANVKGFFYWSLLDNFEWALGYDKRFGLVHVDFETFERTPKASYRELARAITRGDD
jgi:beta-glucosidase